MKIAPTSQKLRGGYYTPRAIAEFLCEWAIRDPGAEVLEPSCGNGIFLEAAFERVLSLGACHEALSEAIEGVEVEAGEASKAADRLETLGLPRSNVHADDFFSFCKAVLPTRRYDAVIGNPPFIRYQNFPEDHRRLAFDLMGQAGLHPNRLTNAWTPFLAAATLLLREGGRLAMVVPAELLQVNYAAELRNFLSTNYTRLTIFTFRRLVFDSIQQEVILLCGERGRSDGEEAWIRTVDLTDLADLRSHAHTDFEHAELKTMDHSSEKWTQYFLSKPELALIRRLRMHRSLVRLGDVASVDVGIVTGMNEFFVLRPSEATRLRIQRHTRRIVTRSGHLGGTIFRTRDWQNNLKADAPAILLDLPRKPAHSLGEGIARYIRVGETLGYHKGYKCRIRDPWYCVPSSWNPDAFLLRQIHGYPKLVLNRALATCTDTIHRVRFKKRSQGPQIVASFLNSLTFAFSEVLGRSYGGGVLELEPSEADNLLLPPPDGEVLSVAEADRLLCKKQDVTTILDHNDHVLLVKGLGLSRTEATLVRRIWKKLRDRRLGRKVATRNVAPDQLRLFSPTDLGASAR